MGWTIMDGKGRRGWHPGSEEDGRDKSGARCYRLIVWLPDDSQFLVEMYRLIVWLAYDA
jgi:hypothetical protein